MKKIILIVTLMISWENVGLQKNKSIALKCSKYHIASKIFKIFFFTTMINSFFSLFN